MAETIWEGRPHNQMRWEFKDPKEARIYGVIILIGVIGPLLLYLIGPYLPFAEVLGFLLGPFMFLTPFLVINMITRHPWRAFRRRKHRYRLTRSTAYIDRTNLLGAPVTDSYPITPEMTIELLERSDNPDVYFGRRVIRRSKDHVYSVPAGFELIPDGKAVYLKMLELQLEVVKNGRP